LRIIVFICLFGISFSLFAQEKKDSTRLIDKVQKGKTTQKIIGALRRTPPPDNPIEAKSELPFLPHQGKIIRKIIISRIGFERSITDTTRRARTFFAKAANQLHNDTKEWVIRDNLFIKEGKPLNAYRVADNERYLRDLEFILDSRIYVRPIKGSKDSIDLEVVTRDVFSLGASASPRGATEYRFRIQEANLAGMGQRFQYGGVIDNERTPILGNEVLYRKTNVLGSFVDASVGYTQVDNGISIGDENESSVFFRLSRPLFNPFTRWAGGLEISQNASVNVYAKPAGEFARYSYDIKDYWAGYSFGFKSLPTDLKENRNRKFLAFRVFEEIFSEKPAAELLNRNLLLYSGRVTVLGQLTFFRQDFYRTRYLLGFGRTEDIPYGYKVSFTGGWEKELDRKRPYIGTEVSYSFIKGNGNFITLTGSLASYVDNDRSEDGLFSLNASRISRILELGKFKVRHQGNIGLSKQLRQKVKRLIDIREENGLIGFRPDSLFGNKRLYWRNEAVLYTPWKLLGFHLAPVARVDVAFLGKQHQSLLLSENFYSGFSLALRARNENLIFNTVEARAYFFPKTTPGVDPVRLEIRSNIRIKYPTNLVTAPATAYDP
jgi:hypothetical protein